MAAPSSASSSSTSPPFRIDRAGPEDLATVAALFRAYAASLDVDLAYQDFEAELAGLPGKYAPPSGCLLLARAAEGKALGCVALRPLGAWRSEMKRLYVAPEGRGLGIGRALVERLIEEARRLGHREIVLDTLPTMTTAAGLYRALGFQDIAPYYPTPIAGTLFLGRALGM